MRLGICMLVYYYTCIIIITLSASITFITVVV